MTPLGNTQWGSLCWPWTLAGHLQAGVVPLHAQGLAPVGRLQQAKLQYQWCLQGALDEGVVAEHRHTHDRGVHDGVLGQSARDNRDLITKLGFYQAIPQRVAVPELVASLCPWKRLMETQSDSALPQASSLGSTQSLVFSSKLPHGGKQCQLCERH